MVWLIQNTWFKMMTVRDLNCSMVYVLFNTFTDGPAGWTAWRQIHFQIAERIHSWERIKLNRDYRRNHTVASSVLPSEIRYNSRRQEQPDVGTY